MRERGSARLASLHRLGLTGGVVAALVVLTSLLWGDFQRDRDLQGWVNHTYQVLVALRGVMSNLDHAEAAQHNFLLTGDQRYLEAFDTAVKRQGNALPDLRRLTADNPVQQEHLKELGAVVEAKVSLLRRAIAVKKAAAVAIVPRDQGNGLMDRCAAILDSMEAEERRLLAARTEAADVPARRMRWILGLGSGSLLLLLLVAGAAIERDLGQRQRAGETSRLLQAIVESSDDAIFSKNLDGVILTWNHGAEHMYGYTRAEAIGRSVSCLLPPGHANDFGEIMAGLKAGKARQHYETERITKDGRRIFVSLTQSPLVEEGRVVGASVLARDITEHKKAEAALRLSEERYRSLVSVSSQIVWVTGPDGVVEDMPLWRDFTGQTVDQVKGWAWLDALHPDDRERTREVWNQAVRTRTFYDTEYRMRREDGQYVDMAVHGVPVIDKDGDIREWVGSCADITVRKVAEEAGRERERTLRRFTEDAPVAIAMFDREMRYLAASRRYRESYQLSGALAGRSHYEVFPEISERWREIYRRCLAGTVERSAADIFPRAGGTTQWLRWEIQPWYRSDGAIGGIVLFTEDVTAQKHAEKELQESEARFRTLANAIPQLCWIADADGWIFWYNQRWYDYTGATPEQMEGWGWQSVHDPQALPAVLERWKGSVASGEPFEMVFPMRAADGTFHPFLTRILPLRDAAGKIVQWFGTNTDITSQQEAQAKLAQLAEQRRLALEAANLGAWDFQFQTGGLIWDQRCRDIFSFSADDADDYDTVMARIHPDDRPGLEDAIRRALAGENDGVYHPECRLVWPDGSIHWLLAHGRVYFEESGGQRLPVRFIGVNLDITERKQAEEEVRQLNRDLEARVVERTAQWQAAAQELEAFAYSVSHDLRAPLRAIDGFSRILLEEHAGNLSGEAQRCLEVVRKNTLRMGALIDDLLAFSRLGRQALRKDAVDMNELARQVLEELRGEEKDRCIEIAAGDLPACQADPALLKQVLINLLSNALKYTRRRNPARIELGAGAVQGDAGAPAYYVRDNGIGFDMRYVDKLFGVFERLHHSEEYEGTGVGLALVQRIIVRHGGRVWAEGAVDQGATFYFTVGSAGPNAN